jgi:hypothetical protein
MLVDTTAEQAVDAAHTRGRVLCPACAERGYGYGAGSERVPLPCDWGRGRGRLARPCGSTPLRNGGRAS